MNVDVCLCMIAYANEPLKSVKEEDEKWSAVASPPKGGKGKREVEGVYPSRWVPTLKTEPEKLLKKGCCSYATP